MEKMFREIGYVVAGKDVVIQMLPEYAQGLTGLKGFSHLMVLWYPHKANTGEEAPILVEKPYRLAPEALGIFATRSPLRPNSICVSIATVASVDESQGTIGLWWIDAEDGTPVLDIKPYHPSSDRVRDVTLPAWCASWPGYYEESGDFAWDKEFLF